mmetsp:Transcript_62438/g.149305  ORF Transcript_62438/g.149305 Transcript_62438/m.149305 type:complete len:555 (-) Transcript_62438:91-1755(-)
MDEGSLEIQGHSPSAPRSSHGAPSAPSASANTPSDAPERICAPGPGWAAATVRPEPAPAAPAPVKKGGKPPAGTQYTFFVGPGNNSELVRQTLERRPWWVLGKEDDPELNLKWLQVRQRAVADSVRKAGNKQFMNHLDGLSCIGRKNELYVNLKAHCEREKLNVHEMAPPTFIVSAGDNCPEYVEFSRVCKAMEKGRATIGRSISKAPMKPNGPADADAASAASTDEQSEVSEAQESPSKSKGDIPASPQKDTPAKGAAGQLPRKPTKMSRGDAITNSTTAGEKNIWIIKPTNNNRGNGIRVFKGFNAIEEYVRKKAVGSQLVIQKYIEHPLLYKRRKFDIRCLVLVDCNMNVYVYKNYYLRTSKSEYSLDNMQDLFIHLTNYAVQKKKKPKKGERELDEDELDEDDEQMEEGCNLSKEEFSAFMADERPGEGDADDILVRMREIIATTLQGVWKKLNPNREKNTFEIFGWDFLVDEDLNVWLIEVNTNPYIGCSSEILRTIFTGMLEGAIKKCIDPHFPPPEGESLRDIEEVDDSDLWHKIVLKKGDKPDKDD